MKLQTSLPPSAGESSESGDGVDFQITVDAGKVSQTLRLTAEKFSQPVRPILEVLAAEMQTAFQEHIHDEEGPDGEWPELRPQTMAIRRHYGHPAEGPRLVRAGDLLQSITTLNLTDRDVEVGTDLEYAHLVQEGGETDRGGRKRQVQAFPFVYLTEDEVRDFMELIREYFLG